MFGAKEEFKSRATSRSFTAKERATILRRPFADKFAVSDLCDEYPNRSGSRVGYASLGHDACKFFCHASLPAWPCSTPLENYIFRQPNGYQLPGVLRTWSSAFVDFSSGEHVVCQLRKLVVLPWLNDMGRNSFEVRSQGAGR